MPRRVIDTAVVEIVPSFPGFEQMVDREVDRALTDIERTAERSTRHIEAEFNELERDIEDVFNDIRISGTIDMDQLVGVAARTAATVSADFQTAGEISEAAFSELRRSANTDMALVAASAAGAARKTESSFTLGALAGSAALAGIGAAAVAGLGAIAVMGLSSAASLEQVQISFNALLGSAEKGEEVFRSLQKFAALTPFEFPEVAAAAKRFLAFNEQVGLSDDFLQSFLTTIGDLASVTGAGAEGLNRIVLALGQMAGKGKVSLEELMQIGEAVPGFSAISAIAQSLGITTGEAMEQISAGAIDATTGINALLAGMQQFPGAAGAMEKQSQTLLGVFSTFKDTVGQALADAFAPVIPAIKDALGTLTPILGEALTAFVPALGGLLTTLMNVIGPLVKAFAPLIGAILMLADELIQALLPAFTELVTALAGPLTDLVMALIPILVELAKPFTEILIALIPLIPAILEIVIALTPLAVLLAKLIAGIAGFITIEALVPIVNLLVKGLNFLVPLIEGLVKWIEAIDWGAVGDAIGGAFSDAWDAVKNFFVGIGRFFAELPGNILDGIKAIPGLLVAAVKFWFTSMIRMIGFGIGLIIFAFTELPGLIIKAVTTLGPKLLDWAGNALTSLKDKFIEGILAVVEFAQSLPGLIIDAVATLGPKFVDFITNLWEEGKTRTIDGIKNIIELVKALPGRVLEFAGQLLSAGRTLFTNLVEGLASGEIFANLGRSVSNLIRGPINWIIRQLNEGIATADAILPGTLPRIPEIPALARGGIAFGPAMIGETANAVPEAAIPLGDNRAMSLLVEAFTRALAGGNGAQGGANNFTVVIEMDGQQFNGRIVSVINEQDRTLKQRVTSRRGHL